MRGTGFAGGPAEDESTMQFLPQSIPEVIAIEPRVHEDERGFFMECWQRRRFAEGGIDVDFVQDNHSRSVAHTLRGLHYQIRQPQGKLVRVVRGAVFDVAVDLRRSSPSFGRWVGVELSSDNRRQLWVPAGFAHGFLVLTPEAELIYKCSDYYHPEHERALLWSDPQLGIDWPLPAGVAPLLSARDEAGLPLAQTQCYP
jgi:dTDP-4-dehydrorhamnose 3,5-epimerase